MLDCSLGRAELPSVGKGSFGVVCWTLIPSSAIKIAPQLRRARTEILAPPCIAIIGFVFSVRNIMIHADAILYVETADKRLDLLHHGMGRPEDTSNDVWHFKKRNQFFTRLFERGR